MVDKHRDITIMGNYFYGLQGFQYWRPLVEAVDGVIVMDFSVSELNFNILSIAVVASH